VAAAINTRATTIIATYYPYLVGKANPNAYVVPSPFLGLVGTVCASSVHDAGRAHRGICSSLFTRGSIKELASREYRWVGTHALSMIGPGTDGDLGLWAGFGCSRDPRL
jgi:hypothetical protein